jgi:hypothetical protein
MVLRQKRRSSSLAEVRDDRERDLALAEIVADRLSHHGLTAGIVERIVDELKGDTEIVPILAERGRLRRGRARDDGSRFARGREQSRGLGRDHLQIFVLANREILR